jgi:hypothetical protein
MPKEKHTPDAPATDPVAGAIGEPAATPTADYTQEREIARRKGLTRFWFHAPTGTFAYSEKALTVGNNRPSQFTEIPV